MTWKSTSFGAIALVASTALVVQGQGATDPNQAPEAAARAPVGVVEPVDPGPFPDSVVPEGETWTVAGQRDGTSEFPIVEYPQVQPRNPGEMDWRHFHTGIEIRWWLRKWAYEHPELVTLYNVGNSYSGTPIYQLTLTDKSTGDDTEKPAAYFEGNRHSGEVTSAESAFWLAWYVIENRGNPRVAEVLDEKAIYIRPVNNPDGRNLYLYTAQTNRSTVRPHDTDVDGARDEDSLEDLNDDDFVTEMRRYVGPGNGTHVIDQRDPAGRVMREVGEGNGDYLIYEEGIDNDDDGEINEDGIGGLDLHRNYPTNWRVEEAADATGRGYGQRGAGAYPLSEPETRHVFTWLMSHTNIGVVNSMDTSVPMHLRAPSTCEQDKCMLDADAAIYERFDARGQRFTGYRYAGNVYRDYATRGGEGEPEPLFGHGPDFGYFGYGSIWYGDELWNSGEFKDYNKDGSFDDWEVSRWCYEQSRDDCFLDWETVEHPEYGEVEVGGINPKFWDQNPQPDLLRPWAAKQGRFNLWMTRQLPQVEIVSATARRATGNDGATHEIRLRLRNTGQLPTALEMAKRIKIVPPDTVGVDGATIVGDPPEYFLDGRETRTVNIRVRKQATSRVSVESISTRGGVDTATVPLR